MKRSILIAAVALVLTGCSFGKRNGENPTTDFPQIVDRGEITAVTLYSSTSYFLYRTEAMGYEYELIKSFASSNGIKLKIIVAESLPRLIDMLEAGEADVAAYPVTVSNEMKDKFLFCGREELTYQVLVQATGYGKKILSNVTELIGKEVCVKSGTPFHERLNNLNAELGDGIIIQAMEQDIIAEELIEMVANGEIEYTVADNRTARLNRTYFRNINIDMPLSFNQRSAWIVRKDAPMLAEAINKWAEDNAGQHSYKAITKRYFELARMIPDYGTQYINHERISNYDMFFRKYARILNWDWRLLAAISYQESHFLDSVESWSGAYGLMGIMPQTAQFLDISKEKLIDPEVNIKAGVEVLRQFRRNLPYGVYDSIQQIKLTLAAYNAGLGHVQDACRLAEKYGMKPNVWDYNVADYILLKREPEYYNDPACKFGYLRGGETFLYVKEVLERYEFYKTTIKY